LLVGRSRRLLPCTSCLFSSPLLLNPPLLRCLRIIILRLRLQVRFVCTANRSVHVLELTTIDGLDRIPETLTTGCRYGCTIANSQSDGYVAVFDIIDWVVLIMLSLSNRSVKPFKHDVIAKTSLPVPDELFEQHDRRRHDTSPSLSAALQAQAHLFHARVAAVSRSSIAASPSPCFREALKPPKHSTVPSLT
jgi:hypothetical protein